MLFETLLIFATIGIAIFFIGIPLIKLVKVVIPPPKKDPLLEAKVRLEAARKETEADAKKLQIQANNALEQRLAAWVEIQKAWATAYGAQRQTPDVVLGGSSSNGTSQSLIDMLTAKTARDLSVNPKP